MENKKVIRVSMIEEIRLFEDKLTGRQTVSIHLTSGSVTYLRYPTREDAEASYKQFKSAIDSVGESDFIEMIHNI